MLVFDVNGQYIGRIEEIGIVEKIEYIFVGSHTNPARPERQHLPSELFKNVRSSKVSVSIAVEPENSQQQQDSSKTEQIDHTGHVPADSLNHDLLNGSRYIWANVLLENKDEEHDAGDGNSPKHY